MSDRFFLPAIIIAFVIVVFITGYAFVMLEKRVDDCPGLVVKTVQGWVCTDLQKSTK